MSIAVVLLAAGKGTRMNSKYQKILHEVGGKPMVQHVFEAAVSASSQPPILVVSHDDDGVQKLLGDQAVYVEQVEKLGTGHATMITKSALAGKTKQVIVTYGDMPLLTGQTMVRLAAMQRESGAALSLLSVMGSPESSFGRVVRGDGGRVVEILEVAQAKQREDPQRWLNITELNAGVYCFDADFLWDNIDKLPLRQARSGQEYYLTDMVETAVSQNRRIEALIVDDPDECLGAGTRAEMVAVEKAFRRRAVNKWLANGVTIVDPDSTYIDQDVTIGQDTVIWPNTYIQGGTTIGEDCTIGPNATLRDAKIGSRCVVKQAAVEGVVVEDGVRVEPFSHVKN